MPDEETQIEPPVRTTNIGMHVVTQYDDGTQVIEPGQIVIMLPMDAIRLAQVIGALAALKFIPIEGLYQIDAVDLAASDDPKPTC